MADPNPTSHPCKPPACTTQEDAIVEAGVLSFVLHEHPDHLTIPELSLAMNSVPEDFVRADAIERAIRDLVGAGLLQIIGGLVLPTRPALHVFRLEVG